MNRDADVLRKREFMQEPNSSSRFVLVAASTAVMTLIVLVIVISLVSWTRESRRADEERALQIAATNKGRTAFNEGRRRFAAPINEYYEHWLEGWDSAADEKRVADIKSQEKAEEERRRAEEAGQVAQAARAAEERRREEEKHAELQKSRRRAVWQQAKQKLKGTFYQSSRWEYHMSENRDAVDMWNSSNDSDVRDFALKFITSQKSLIAKEEFPYIRDIVAIASVKSWTEWKQLDDEAESESWGEKLSGTDPSVFQGTPQKQIDGIRSPVSATQAPDQLSSQHFDPNSTSESHRKIIRDQMIKQGVDPAEADAFTRALYELEREHRLNQGKPD